MGNHLFVFFGILDVPFAINSCLNCSFFFTFMTYSDYSKQTVLKPSATDQIFLSFFKQINQLKSNLFLCNFEFHIF